MLLKTNGQSIPKLQLDWIQAFAEINNVLGTVQILVVWPIL
ncbi:hypothetical protein AALP_AAs39574U000100 [Arabis alpina]|uniref:Uncharacterized protein n=1 Tax=Arabis alpina TaxID=50452 RepID=A0A087FX66_ARAAL|nr:hypothetical protein AALP_AAs39574U000100 [Arabis alpina]